jgi:hypothetical protein
MNDLAWDDSTRLTYLTRYYYELQGIRTAPAWLSILAIQIDTMMPPSCNHGHLALLIDTIVLLTIVLMGLFSWLAGRYYRHQFGWLQPTWIIFPKSRLYWSLLLGSVIFAFYRIIFTSSRGDLPYIFTLVWISPFFNKENPPIRRMYYALAGAVVVSTALCIQLAHWGNRIIIAIQCVVLLALGLADHLLLMSLRAPVREEADA